MLKFKDNPQKLMAALNRFLSNYYGKLQKKKQRDPKEISAWKIPNFLKYFYSFAEKYSSIVDPQSGLLINKGDNVHHKRLFIGEFLYWRTFTTISTQVAGDDPPVWISQSKEYESQYVDKLVCNSLSQFITTFCLEQTVFESVYCYNFAQIKAEIKLSDLLSAIARQDYQIDLLWETINFWDIVHDKTLRTQSFYSVEDAILICSNDLCGTNYKNANRLLASILPLR